MTANEFDKILNYDALLEAEQLTGKSYKDDETTSAFGLLLFMQQNKDRTDELALRGDSYRGMTYSEYLAILHELGFTKIDEVKLSDGEFDHLYWRDGLLLSCDSYRGQINSARIYFNGEFSDFQATHSHRLSGHLNESAYCSGKYVWVGDFEVMEGLRHKLQRLEADATICGTWVERPFVYVPTQDDRKAGINALDATEARIAKLPPAIREAITPKDANQ